MQPSGATAATRPRQTYDHRLRRLVQETGDLTLAIPYGVPLSTARGWTKAAQPTVITLRGDEVTTVELQGEVEQLRARLRKVTAIVRLLLAVIKALGISLKHQRLSDEATVRVARAVRGAKSWGVPTTIALALIGLSRRRLQDWSRSLKPCSIDAIDFCPRMSPQQLTGEEVRTIKELVTSDEYRHVPTGTLALLAQRLHKVFASPTTWYRLVRIHKWRRPRGRVHPRKPKVGIRASAPNEIWHIDTTILRLLNGAHVYLHAVIDNFSRRVLAWRVAERCNPANTVEILVEAASLVLPSAPPPTVLTDGGVENFNAGVDELVDFGVIRRLLALTQIAFSNSLIEAWWRSLKHQWLFLNSLDSATTVRRLVTFYVTEHNTKVPHSAFSGQTPDEMYFGTGLHIPGELAEARLRARAARLEANRCASCATCPSAGAAQCPAGACGGCAVSCRGQLKGGEDAGNQLLPLPLVAQGLDTASACRERALLPPRAAMFRAKQVEIQWQTAGRIA